MKKQDYAKLNFNNWAIGQFNISNLETLKAIWEAARKLKSPVILGTSEGESKFIGLKTAAALIDLFKEETKLPIFLNLDHARSFKYIKKAIDMGYDLVHFDGSRLPLSENIRIAQKVVKYAHPRKVMVEGEVGVIGGALTDPIKAWEFVKKTKVDRLAVNIGTFHGMKKPEINFQKLKEIKKQVGRIPLVLHGGSGVSEEDIKRLIEVGVRKININTELRLIFTQTLKRILRENPQETVPYKYMPEVIGAVQKVVEEKIKLFGSNNKT